MERLLYKVAAVLVFAAAKVSAEELAQLHGHQLLSCLSANYTTQRLTTQSVRLIRRFEAVLELSKAIAIAVIVAVLQPSIAGNKTSATGSRENTKALPTSFQSGDDTDWSVEGSD